MNWQAFTELSAEAESLEDILGKPSQNLTEEVEIEEMFWERLMDYTLHTQGCLGMVGIQLGMPYRGFYLALPGIGEFRFRNPIIKSVSTAKIPFQREGCMSEPGKFFDTLRHTWIEMYDDINGTHRYDGLLGTCIQHELDHLNGDSYYDHQIPADYKRKKIGRNDPCPYCLAEGKLKVPRFKRCKLHFR